MFDQFRQQYPQGSIISNLVKIHSDQYIVSVSVAHDSKILVTTLAADTKIEVAEARAMQQALLVLGLSQPVPVVTAMPEAPSESEELSLPELGLTVQPIAPTRQFMPEPKETPQIRMETPMIAEMPTRVQENSMANGYQPDAPDPDEPSLSVTDMIPLINMELKRLNWSREKGRDCIIALYNKRSSSLLSDEELLGLLRHLQAQTVPD